MGNAVSILSKEAGWRLKAVWRPKRFFSKHQLLNLYKCQVLSYIESGVAGYYHAAPSILDALDRIQRRLLRELGVSEEETLETHKLAPLQTRRDIAMLGLLQRIAWREAPQQLLELFPFAPPRAADGMPTRLRVRRHVWQLQEPVFRTDVLQRSLFGLTVVYNLLPPEVVAQKSVSKFQSSLQMAVRKAALMNVNGWQVLLSLRHRPVRALDFQAFFDVDTH